MSLECKIYHVCKKKNKIKFLKKNIAKKPCTPWRKWAAIFDPFSSLEMMMRCEDYGKNNPIAFGFQLVKVYD